MPRGSGKRAAEKAPGKVKDDRTQFLCTLAEKFAPKSIGPHVVRFAPQIAAASLVLQFQVLPVLYTIYEKCKVYLALALPYYTKFQLNELLPALAGLIMCFFGGEFTLTIVAAECFVTTSYTPICSAYEVCKDQYQKALEAHKKDDTVDDDGDGVADVLQISDSEYASRKMLLLAKALDPEKLNNAIKAITAAGVLIISALHVSFVRTLALGKAVGNSVRRTAHRFVIPKAIELTPDEYKKWTPTVIEWICTLMAISFAFMIQRVISAFHSALRGGMLASRTVLHYLKTHGILSVPEEDTYIDEIVGMAVAAFGFLFQFQSGFSIFFPLNVLLFPVSLLEYILQVVVSFSA